jgi:hypothetical protein
VRRHRRPVVPFHPDRTDKTVDIDSRRAIANCNHRLFTRQASFKTR